MFSLNILGERAFTTASVGYQTNLAQFPNTKHLCHFDRLNNGVDDVIRFTKIITDRDIFYLPSALDGQLVSLYLPCWEK